MKTKFQPLLLKDPRFLGFILLLLLQASGHAGMPAVEALAPTRDHVRIAEALLRTPQASGQNLVYNPSFEFGTNSPDGWGPFGGGTAGWDSSSVHTGSRAVWTNVADNGANFNWSQWRTRDFIDVTPNQEYFFSVWHTANTTAEFVLAEISFYRFHPATYISSVRFFIHASSTWYQFTSRLQSPAEAYRAEIVLSYPVTGENYLVNGRVWWDDVYLGSSPPDTPTPVPTTPVPTLPPCIDNYNVDIEVLPDTPTEREPITLRISGVSGDVCVPTYLRYEKQANSIHVYAEESTCNVICSQILTGWEFDVQLGTLPPGSYTAHFDLLCESVANECYSTTFTVVPSPDTRTPTSTSTSTRTPTRTPTATRTATPTPETRVITGQVTDGHGNPLVGVSVRLWDTGANQLASDHTKAGGRYDFDEVPVRSGYMVQVILIDDGQRKQIQWGNNRLSVIVETPSFTSTDRSYVRNISFTDSPLIFSVPFDVLDDLAGIYYHTQTVEQFIREDIGFQDYSPPRTVWAFAPTANSDAVYYCPGPHIGGCTLGGNTLEEAIVMGPGDSRRHEGVEVWRWIQPMNREWHEHFHHLMEVRLGMPEHATQEQSHGGYNNSWSDNSWMEGWAEFWPMVFKDILRVGLWTTTASPVCTGR